MMLLLLYSLWLRLYFLSLLILLRFLLGLQIIPLSLFLKDFLDSLIILLYQPLFLSLFLLLFPLPENHDECS